MVIGRALMVVRQIFRSLSVSRFFFVSVVVVLMFSVISTTHGQTEASEAPQHNLNQRFSTTSAVVIVVLMLGFFITGFIFIFIHCRRVANNNMLLAAAARAAENNGLSPEVLNSLPTMAYSKVKGLRMGKSSLECAVCLCEFEDHDELTLLPKCYHAFHPQCIGVWLANHTTCPVCRVDLGEPVQEVLSVTEETSSIPPVDGHLSDDNVVEITDEPQQPTPPEHVSVRVEQEDKELREIGSLSRRSHSSRIFRRWRSRSARLPMGGGGEGIGKTWREDERERFTLRVPENLRKELLEGTSTLRRSASVTTASRHLFNIGAGAGAGEESSRSTFRSRGSPSPLEKTTGSPLGKTNGSPLGKMSSPLGKMAKQGKSWTEKIISRSGPLDCISAGVRSGAGSDKEDSSKSTADLLPRVSSPKEEIDKT